MIGSNINLINDIAEDNDEYEHNTASSKKSSGELVSILLMLNIHIVRG